MAKATWEMPEDFMRKISRLESSTDEIIPEVLKAGGEIALEEVRMSLNRVILQDKAHKRKQTGQLTSALGLTKARVNRDGDYDVKVGFAENRKDGKANAMIANVIEYGKFNQPARPFLKPAKSKCKGKCIKAMEQKLEEKIKKL